MAFIPLPFHPQNTVFERRGWRCTTGQDDLKMVAVSRLMLDNVEHVKAYWIMLSTPHRPDRALSSGRTTSRARWSEEQIAHAAGARDPRTEGSSRRWPAVRVAEAGKIPVQRDTLLPRLRQVVKHEQDARRERAGARA